MQPLLQGSFLLKEVAPISQNLSTLGAAGLGALDYLDRGERPSAAWVTEQLAMIEQAKKPHAELLLVVTPAFQKLVEASAGQGTALPAK